MTLKQRRTPLDPLLLHVVVPLLHDSPLRPLPALARLWHTSAAGNAPAAPAALRALPGQFVLEEAAGPGALAAQAA